MKGPKSRNWLIVVILIAGIYFIIGCSDKPDEPDNLAPEKASNPSPVNLQSEIAQTGLMLQWDCSDPEGDSIFYDVYLGTDGNPPKVASGIIENYYYADYLHPDEVYYWRVVARDKLGNQSISPFWSFTTRSAFDFVYPLEVGYQWEYTRQVEYFNFDPPGIDSLITPIPAGISQVIIDDTIDVDGIMMYEFYQHYDDGDDVFEQNSYYSNLSHGLLYYGTDSPGAGIGDTPAPIRHPKKFVFHGRYFNSIDELLSELGQGSPAIPGNIAMAYADSMLVLFYPLQVGSVWNLRGDGGDPIWIDKKVIGTANVQVPAGSFECFLIQWFYDFDRDGTWDEGATVTDYICAAGLIKRVGIVEDIVVSTYEHPTGIGTMDMRETLELTGFSLRKTE
jgi:hypothetical protein